ncbi:hypothetical protein GQ464_018080 [Rhodocaloribacter litoris]|uniref:hypothetical protein n=1 Tax=Rhodocaloribacter litoris TaxID=2558931 RepID=UPI001424422D|nr:hypothetical protein [Rhodocaloribacter litoris]QXD15278.1 hypothetical protein GQ464_018080 [Rhodocaloribacter litoris]
MPSLLTRLQQAGRTLRLDRPGHCPFWGAMLGVLLPVVTITVVLPVLGLLREPPPAATRVQAPDDAPGATVPARTLDSLRTLEAFLAARLALADQNQIGLSLDLVERTLQIEIAGVPVRVCSLRDVRLGRALAVRGFPEAGGPRLFTLEHAVATLPHTPIRVVRAPRDTTEYRSRPPLDVPVETTEPHFALYFDGGLVLHVSPSPSHSPWTRLRFSLMERLATTSRDVRRLLHGSLPRAARRIEVKLSPEDAKAVYRALPPGGRLALRMPPDV